MLSIRKNTKYEFQYIENYDKDRICKTIYNIHEWAYYYIGI